MLYFIHIPKTAGTSLRNFLQTQVYGDRLQPIYYDLGYWNAAEARAKLTGQEVFYGHFCYGLHRLFHDSQPRYLSMLRDPVERIVSVYQHMKRHADAGWPHEIIREENLSLREFVERGICGESNNHITKMLSADYGRLYRWRHLAANRFSQFFQGRPFYQVHGRRHLRRALGNVQAHFEFVGFADHFAACMDYLLSKNGLAREGAHMPVDNVSAGNGVEPLDPATRRAVETANDLDLELYHSIRNDPARYHAGGS